jgi:hypothetical protein
VKSIGKLAAPKFWLSLSPALLKNTGPGPATVPPTSISPCVEMRFVPTAINVSIFPFLFVCFSCKYKTVHTLVDVLLNDESILRKSTVVIDSKSTRDS